MVIISPTGLRTAKNLVSDVDSKIKEYEEKFNKLRLLFQERGVLQTNITVLRILDAVKDLGRQSHYYGCSVL
jgi:hypothetical protein